MWAKVLQVVLLIKRICKGAAALILFLLLFVAAAFIYLDHQEVKQDVVQLQNIDQEVVFFYRDDCPDCQKIFNKVYLSGAVSSDQINVNLKQEKNRKYISSYNIDQVPTIIHKGKRYVGVKEIKKFLNNRSYF